MAKSAADTNEKMEAKHKVTALQKAILESLDLKPLFNEPSKKLNSEDWIYDYLWNKNFFVHAEPVSAGRPKVLEGEVVASGANLAWLASSP